MEPINLTERRAIYPKPTWTFIYAGDYKWICEACGGVIPYTPKTYEGPEGLCPHCGVAPYFISTTLIAKLNCIPPRSLKVKSSK